MGEGGIGPKIREGIGEIRGDRKHGAGFLALKAVSALELLAEESRAGDSHEFQSELGALREELSAIRPTICSIANAISWVVDSILGRAEGKSVEELKTLASACASYVREELKRRSLLACYKAQDLIVSGDSIMTASYSSQVVSTFRRAKAMGKMFTILALESLSRGKSYGQALALELKKENIKVLVIPDVDIARSIALANKALIGTDAILPQGYVINGTPSLRLAKVAQRNHLPFYVVGEMIKMSPHFFEPDQGFDIIPPSLITQIITEQEIHGEDQILRPRI